MDESYPEGGGLTLENKSIICGVENTQKTLWTYQSFQLVNLMVDLFPASLLGFFMFPLFLIEIVWRV